MADKSPELTLYHAIPSRSSIARWMLEEVGEPYEARLLNLRAGDQRQPDYLKLNPMGKVPTLDHGGVIVTEAAAICGYLADAFPQAGLAPAIGAPERGPYLKWLFFGPSCLEPAITEKAMNREPPARTMAGWGDYDTVLEVLRNAVAEGPYLLGEQFTAADVVIGAGIRWGTKFELLPMLAEFKDYLDRLNARPALQRQIALDASEAQRTAG
jgi:glutathione S-transferase